MVFDKQWFDEHQQTLVKYLNSPMGRITRRSLGIGDWRNPVCKVAPSSHSLLLPDGRVRFVGSPRRQHAESLRSNYRFLWEAMHNWDMRFANRLMPAWNTGFDTYSSQPNETDGFDTFINNDSPTTNFGTNTELRVGEYAGLTVVARTLIKFDLASIPSGAAIDSAVLSLWVKSDLSINARDYKVYRVVRDWVESGATWNVWKTGSNWFTAGCGGDGPDYDGSAWATTNFTATEATGTEKQFGLNTTEFNKFVDGTYNNYGWIIRADTESNDAYAFYSSSEATLTTRRPKLVAEYTEPGGDTSKMFLVF